MSGKSLARRVPQQYSNLKDPFSIGSLPSRGITNHSFVRSSASDFFNTIHPQRSVTGNPANGRSRPTPAIHFHADERLLPTLLAGQAALECATAISRPRTRCRRLCFTREDHSLSIIRGRHPCGAPTSGAIMGPVVRPTNQGFSLSRFGRLDDGCAAAAVARLWKREPRSTATGQAITPRRNAPQHAFPQRYPARSLSRRLSPRASHRTASPSK